VRLLWLTPEVPEPAGSGGAIRAFHQLRGLAERGVDLTVVAPAYEPQARRAREAFASAVRLELAPRPASQPREGLGAVLADRALALAAVTDPWLGWQARVFWREIRGRVERELARHPPDAVIVEHEFALRWASELPPSPRIGGVFQNTYWTVYERRSTAFSDLEARRLRRYVARHVGRLSHAWTVSDVDRAELGRLAPGLLVDVVPNGVDVRRFAPPDAPGEPDRLLFSGTLDYPPNAEGIAWFADEVLPRLRVRRPGVRLTVVGRNPPRRVRALDADPAIDVTGWVDDLAPYQRAAAVAVAPLRSGSGTKLKVLEALAVGRPLVATSVAAEGIDVVDGVHLLVRDDPPAFAEAVADLLEDRDRAERLAIAGRRLVVDRYDWNVLADLMHRSLERWLA
jgi:polysaccharide biosynthesis protein PslH